MAEAVLPDGSVVRLPDFALEATQAQMLATLKVLLKEDTESQDLYKKLLKEVEDGNKANDSANEKAQKALDEINKANKDKKTSFGKAVSDRIEGDIQSVFVGAGNAISGLATAAVLATGAIIGFGAKVYSNLTNNLQDLTQAGLGFSDSMGNTASSAIVEFNKLGYTTAEASQAMVRFASVTASIGRSGTPGSLTDTIRKFKSMTDNGLSLGMSFKDANEALMEELETRNDLGLLEGSVTNRQLSAASQQIKMQTAYSAALGISADKLREMTKRSLEGNVGLIALTSKFGPQLYEGASAFSTAMNARGEAFARLGDLFLEAGSQTSVYLSDAANDLATASPKLNTALREFNQTLTGNTLTTAERGMAQAAKIQELIGTLNNAEIERLRRLAESNSAGAEGARLILLAYRDFKKTEQAMQRVRELMSNGISVDQALKARLRFDNALSQVKTTFDALVNSLAIQFAPMMESLAHQFEKFSKAMLDVTDSEGNVIQRGIGTSLREGFTSISNAILKLFGFDTSDLVDPDKMRTSVVGSIDRITTNITNAIEGFNNYISLDKFKVKAEDGTITDVIDWSLIFQDMGKQVAAGILNGIGDFLWSLPGMLYDGAKTLISDFFSKPDANAEKEVGASISAGVLKILGFLFAAGAAKSIAAVAWNKVKGFFAGESAESLGKQRSGGLLDRLRGRGGPAGPAGAPPGGSPGGGGAGPGGAGPGGAANRGAGIASLLKNIGSGIASLGTGLGRFVKAIGLGAGKGIQAIFTGLAKGIGALGKPNVLLGGVALGIISGAVFIAGKAFQQFQQLDWKTVGMGLTAIAGLGVIAGVAGAFAPALLAGALAIGAIGLALQLFPTDTLQTFGDILNSVVNTVMVNMPPIINAVADGLARLIEVGAQGFDTIMNSVGTLLERLSGLDAVNLGASALAITAVGAALAGLGVGSVVGGIGNFFGSLFGGGDPFARLLEVAKSAPELDKLSNSLRTLASVLGSTASVIESLAVQPLESIVDQFTRLWQNLSQVELNVAPYQNFAAISTAALLGNAAAINQIAAANRAQNRAYAEFVSLDEARFAKNVTNAFNYNKANKGETEGTSILDTVRNMFNALRSSPATPVNPVSTTPTSTPTGTPTGTSTTTGGAAGAAAERNPSGKTQLEVITDMERTLRDAKTLLEDIKKNTG